jgi:hypothetical protein
MNRIRSEAEEHAASRTSAIYETIPSWKLEAAVEHRVTEADHPTFGGTHPPGL